MFTRTRTEASPYGDLWLIDVGSGRTRLLAAGNYAWPEWSPNSDAVITIDLGDRSEKVLTAGCCASVAPDGVRFVVSRED